MSARLLLIMCLVVFSGCSSGTKKMTDHHMLMSTYINVDVCVSQQQREKYEPAMDELWLRLEEISWKMNVYDEKSDVAKINSSFNQPVEIDSDTLFVIEEALRVGQLTSGAFDITIWPLIEFWIEQEKANKLPLDNELSLVKSAVGHDNLVIMNNSLIKTLHPQTKVDLGGIAKGYAIDEASRILRKHGFNDFQVDAGGDIYLGGLNCKNKPWRIGIRDPRDNSKLLAIVEVSNQAVTTSGKYVQYMTIEDKQYSHIINPQTGWPQEVVVSASVLAPTAIEADALSTALTVLNESKGRQIIDSLGEKYASIVVIMAENDTIESFFSKTFKSFAVD